MSRYSLAFLLLPLFALAGCLKPGSPDSREAPASTPQAASHYSMSEAAVQLEHDYDGRIEPDVAETLTLRFRHGYTAGLMRVAFYAHDGLELYNAEAPRVLRLDAAQPLRLPVQLMAPSAGVYYLSIFATVETAGGEVAKRIFGLDLKAGDEREAAHRPRQSRQLDRVEETPGGERIIVMPAQETVASP